jgi:hypothetical protein
MSGFSEEFEVAENLMNLKGYKRFVGAISTGLPGIRYDAEAPATNSYKCSWEGYTLWGVSGKDSTVMPVIEPQQGRVWRVVSSVEIAWDEDSKKKEEDMDTRVRSFLAGQPSHGASWTITSTYTVTDHLTQVIVSDGDDLPTAFDKGSGIAAAFFWSGIVHAFRVDRVPIIKGYVKKYDAVIDKIPSQSVFEQVSCRHLDSSTKTRKRNLRVE